MSDTIQARHYTARQATLLQRRPRELIEAAEHVEDPLEDAYSRTMQVLCDRRSLLDENVNIIGVGGTGQCLVTTLTAGTKVVLVGISRPTTDLEVRVDLEAGQSENIWTRWAEKANEALRNGASTERRQTTAAARWRVERLSTLQAAFGFTIQDLAAVLGITRPQLYKWLDASNDIKLQEANRVRLAIVERIAKEWMTRSKAPLSTVSDEAIAAGGTVFGLMSAEIIDDVAVFGAFDQLVARLHEKPKSRSQLLRDAGFTRRPSVRALPSDE